MISTKLLDAIEFASLAHKDQVRKGEPIPYVSHPFAVGLILLNTGYSEDVVIAGILHDVVEDTKFSSKDIEEKFGLKISELVAGVTEDNSIASKQEKKQKYLETVKNSSNDIKAICGADMLHNRLCVLREMKNGLKIWDIFKITKEEYLKNSYEKLTIIKTTLNDTIVSDIEKTLQDIKDFV